MPFPQASQALARFTVLDLTRVRSGPTCVRQLADWGANVIKIEMPPDEKGGEGMGGPREGSDFQNLHRNKRSMTLNLKDPAGRAAFLKMVEKADVVVENFRPDVKRRLGVDYEDLKKVNPRIVYGSISGFGQDGPYENRPGFDQIAQGMGGLMSITGLPGQGPVRVGIPVADLRAGLFCALGILTALLEREVSGEGPARRHLAAAGADLHARLPGGALAAEPGGRRSRPATIIRPRSRPACSRPPTATSTSPPPAGRSGSGSAARSAPTRCCKNPDYATSQAALAEPQGAQRARSAPTRRRRAAPSGSTSSTRPACRAGRSTTSTRCSPIRRSSISASRRARRRRTARPLGLVGQPMTLSRTPSKMAARPPALGEHTDEVLKEFGFSAERNRRAAQAKASMSRSDAAMPDARRAMP